VLAAALFQLQRRRSGHHSAFAVHLLLGQAIWGLTGTRCHCHISSAPMLIRRPAQQTTPGAVPWRPDLDQENSCVACLCIQGILPGRLTSELIPKSRYQMLSEMGSGVKRRL